MTDSNSPSGSPRFGRLVLFILSAIALLLVGSSLLASWDQPQIQSRLELYQTNVVLLATGELDEPVAAPSSSPEIPDRFAPTPAALRSLLLGPEVFSAARQQYEAFREGAEAGWPRLREAGLAKEAEELGVTIAETDLRLGLLHAKQGNVAEAIKTWQGIDGLLSPGSRPVPALVQQSTLAQDLEALWRAKPQPVAGAADLATQGLRQRLATLDGWFRQAALARLDRLQGDQAALAALQTEATATADELLVKLLIANVLPGLAGLVGLGLVVGLGVQWAWRRETALLAIDQRWAWPVAWGLETVLWVLVGGFFFLGQIAIPLLSSGVLALVGIHTAQLSGASQAGVVLLRYGLMAAGSVAVLRWAVGPFLPLQGDWFAYRWQGRWPLWAIGGYAAALPLVVGVSLLNQLLWQGRGGSNPILQIVLENRDPVAIVCFFLTAAVAAPVFEETLFRGFLLPSLTQRLPVWGAIGLSSLIFALAHLSVSEILPLTMLGAILGVVYVRSRNLLASIVLHGLWNGGTLLTLLLLGSTR